MTHSCGKMMGLVAAMLIGTGGVAQAWDFAFSPYGWGMNVDGEVGVGDVSAEVSADFKDLVDDLEWGVMLSLEAVNDNNTFVLLDAVHVSLSSRADIAGTIPAQVDLDETIVMAAIGKNLAESPFSVYGGVRYADIEVEVAAGGPLGGVSTDSDGIFDPVIGGRIALPFNERAGLNISANIGGFGVGSDFSWEAVAYLYTGITDSITGAVGYRTLSFDYSEDVDFDATMHGWLAGVTFAF